MWTGLLPSAPLPLPPPPPATGLASDSSFGWRREKKPLKTSPAQSGLWGMEMHLVSLFLMENEEFSISLMTLLRAESTNTCAAGDCYLPSTLSLQLQFLAELGSLVDFQSSPLSASFGWRPPVWPTTDLWEARTWVPQLVKAVVASNQPPQSLSSGTWQHLLFPPRASGSKVSPQRTLVLSLQESLTMQHSCPQAAPRPRGPPDWCEVRENSCPVGWSTRDSPWSLPCEMPWLQRDYRRD